MNCAKCKDVIIKRIENCRERLSSSNNNTQENHITAKYCNEMK